MAIAFVSAVSLTPSGNAGGTTGAIDTTGANLLIASVCGFATPTIGDSKGNTWNSLSAHGPGSSHHRFWYCFPTTVGTSHTFTLSGSGIYGTCRIYAFSGAAGYDKESGSGATGGTTPIASGSVTPSTNGALILTALSSAGSSGTVGDTDTVSPGGFTQTTQGGISGIALQQSTAYQIQTTAAAINPTWSFVGSSGTRSELSVSTAVFLAALPPVTPPLVAVVKRDSSTGGGWSPTGGTTDPIDTTGANLLVMCAGWFNTLSVAVSDSKGNTWVPLTQRANGGVHQMWYAANPVVGAGHRFTISFGFSVFPSMVVYAFSGAHATPFDVQNGATSSATGPTSLATGSITPSVNGAYIVSGLQFGNGSGPVTVTTALASNLLTHISGGAAYMVQGTAAAINPAWGYTGASQAGQVSIAAFKPGISPPTLASITPSSGDQGAAVAVTLTGTNFVVGATTVAVSGAGVTVSGVTVASGTSLTASFTIAAGATAGARTVTVTTAGGTSGGQTFTITVPAPPTLASVTPNVGAPVATVAVTLTGTNFVVGATTVAVSGSGVTVSGVTVASGTSLTASFAIAPTAAAGARTVTVTTAGGTSGGQTFTIVVPDLVGSFRWGLAPDALTNETAPQAIDDTAPDWVPFSEVLTDLLPATTYYYQAIADDGIDVWYGEILSFATLGEQTFADGGVSHPLTWITLTKKDGTKHPYSEVDLNDPADYYDGYKRPRVERFLTIARGLSDRDGQIEHMSFGAVLSDIATDRFDTDREFRSTLADAVNKYLTNRPLEVWFIDDVQRRQLGLPRLAAVGYVNDYAPSADLHFEIKGADWLKKKFSRKRRAQQSWQPLITAADFPDCPDETINSPAPLIYGSLGLGGAEPVVGVTVTVNAQPTAAPASFALALAAGGRLAGITRYYKVSGIVGGQETIQAGPLVATTTDANKTIRLTWTAVPSATAIYVYSSHRPDFLQFAYVKLAGGATSYDDTTTPPNQDKRWLEGTAWVLGLRINLTYYVYANLGGGLFSEPGQGATVIAPNPPKAPATDLDHSIAVAWTAHAGATGGYRIIRRKSYYSDWDAVFDRQWDVAAGVLTVTDDLITTSAVTMPTGELIAVEAAGQAEAIFVGVGSYGDPTPQPLSALLVARHACARLGKIYIPQTTANVDGETETTYAPVPDSAFGVTWFAPDHPGWIYPEKYVEINGQWFTLIFTTVEPLPEKVLVDVDGIEPIGDGTGDVIRSLVDQRLHFMVNFVAPDPAWASGPYLTAADTVFPHLPAIPLVDADSHATVKAALAARLVSGDYEGAMIIGADHEFVTANDALARFQLSGDFDQTFNRKGQDMVTCEPIEPDPAAPTIDDVLSIREGSFNLVDQVQSAFFNIIPYVHSRDYTGRERTGWYGNNEIRAEDSILNYDQEREAPVFELHAGRANTPQGSATIADVMARKLARYQDPRRIGSLQMPFEGLEYEPGSTAAITHIEGIGATGWAGREVRFIRHEVEPTTGIVRLDFYDLTAVIENHEAIRRRREGGS